MHSCAPPSSLSLVVSIATLSGYGRARERWKAATTCDPADQWKHRAIAVAEFCPIVGAITAVADLAITSSSIEDINPTAASPLLPDSEETHLTLPSCSTWKPRLLPTDIAIEKMWHNSLRAIEEHAATHQQIMSTLKALSPIEQFHRPIDSPLLRFSATITSSKGSRPDMEDAHFVKEIPQGLIAGVFDGHGGQEIALYAAQQFANRFSQQLIRSEGNVHHALETLLYQIHEEASGKHDWMLIGSTALVCFFDPRSHIVYTATIGDSEAHIYRSLEGKTQSIPLSCVRNWSFEHEARRVAIALKKPAIAKIWPHAKRPKTLRYPLGYGLNVSRAIGDSFAREMSNPSAIIAKPKISIHILNPQDVVVLTCDGVKDFVEDSEIIALVDEDKKLLAQKITSYAINKKNSTDNVTVVVIDVE